VKKIEKQIQKKKISINKSMETSAVTGFQCGGTFNIHFIANLPLNVPVSL